MTAMLPPNPTVTGNEIGEQAPVKSLLFLALSSRLEKSKNRHSAAGIISHHDPLEMFKVSAPTSQSRPCHLTLEQARSFLGKDQAMEVSASTTPDMTTATIYKRAHALATTRRRT